MFQVHNVANEADFARGMLEGSYQCSKCFQYSERQWCGALRASEWDRETGIRMIWHQGKHICLTKKPPIEKDDAAKMITMLKHIMQLNPYATKTQIMDLGSHYHLSRGDHRLSQLFIRICMKNKSIYEQALKEVCQETVGLDWSSINAVVKLKRGQDSVDPYHIYKVNDKKWNSRPTFVMKSSKLSAETALKMDTRNKKTALTECVVFMDGLHSRVKDYITLTLWVENPIIEKTQRLASMECLTEDTENVTIFLQNFLDILREVKNDPQYMWKPRMIMADENGANKKAVGNVLGEEMRQQTISCQWHFLRCAKKVLHHINKEDRDEFLKLANALIHKAVTKNAYEEYRTKLETICIHANCKSWCDFWHRRRFHFVSAFRGFFLPGVNLAEAGQAGMKRQQNHQLLSLVDAAYKDISAWLQQDELYKATLDNCTTQKGWACNMAQKQADEHRAQEDRVPGYLKDLQKGNPWMEETMIDNFNDFHPEENSGHDFTSTSNRGRGYGWGGCGSRGRGTTSYY